VPIGLLVLLLAPKHMPIAAAPRPVASRPR